MTDIVSLPTDLFIPSTKVERMQEIKLTARTLKKEVIQNTVKEQTVMEYVEDFRRQFVQIFPKRKQLLLCPKNEAGVKKFVCTSIRPTSIASIKNYELEACASFVSDFIHYLPLKSPTKNVSELFGF